MNTLPIYEIGMMLGYYIFHPSALKYHYPRTPYIKLAKEKFTSSGILTSKIH